MNQINRAKIIPSSYDREQVWIIPSAFLGLTMISIYIDPALAISFAIIFSIAVLKSILLIPYRIVKESNSIVFKRMLGDVRISEIERVVKVEFTYLRRKFGIGGLLGFYGYYHLEGWGDVKIMAKSSKKLVLIISGNSESFTISVDDENELVDFLK